MGKKMKWFKDLFSKTYITHNHTHKQFYISTQTKNHLTIMYGLSDYLPSKEKDDIKHYLVDTYKKYFDDVIVVFKDNSPVTEYIIVSKDKESMDDGKN